ncbi:hypothetical protein ACTXKY_08455 [Corynebacterium variabile]|uniref:hypothetical protein n=1 Tax=Corynebacterium variabile TaxID=1727 RepID=UPI0028E8BB75|nr:hypothetical protein [Corynebacterium variabile]
MDINSFLEPFHQFGSHAQELPEQARQFVEQHAPSAPAAPAPKAPVTGSSILGS